MSKDDWDWYKAYRFKDYAKKKGMLSYHKAWNKILNKDLKK